MPTPRPSFPVGTRVNVKIDGILVQATYAGWHDRYDMAQVRLDNGRIVPRKIFGVAASPAPTVVSETTPQPELFEVVSPASSSTAAPAVQVRPVQPSAEFDVNQRFGFLENLVDMVVSGASNSLIVTGPGGLGKTFTVMQRIQLAGLKEDEDFVVIRGFSTPKSMYRALYENLNRLVIFDDCDSVLDHPVSLNILKGALDSYSARNVSWLTERPDDSLPDQFEFRGSVIFISNKTLDSLNQPVLSRALFVDLSMTTDEKIIRMGGILSVLRPDLALSVKGECLDLIARVKDRIPDLTIRSLLKVIEVRLARPEDWRVLSEYVVTAGI